jgi:hypothetical protein
MGFCNGPSVVNPLRALILPPVSCFCPGSAHGRHLMVSDKEQVGQSYNAQSSLRRCLTVFGLT